MFEIRVTINVIVIGDQAGDGDIEYLILNPVDQIIIDCDRRVIDRRKIYLDPRRRLAPEFIAHRIVEKGIAKIILGAQELDLAVGAQ